MVALIQHPSVVQLKSGRGYHPVEQMIHVQIWYTMGQHFPVINEVWISGVKLEMDSDELLDLFGESLDKELGLGNPQPGQSKNLS